MSRKLVNGMVPIADSKKKKKFSTGTRKKDDFLKVAFEGQIEIPLAVITIIVTGYALSFKFFDKFIILQYQNPETGLYTKGLDDAYFIFFWIATFTLLRAVVMAYILIPIAELGEIKKRRQRIRFAEQGWLLIYYSISWSLGMYLMYHSPYWLNSSELWNGYPHTNLSYLFKWYYLVQCGFWLQQVFVLNIEERRKDFVQMAAHHVITISLIYSSYMFNFTRIGNAVLCVMDFTDILLPAAKMLKYLGFKMACDALFGVFMVSWVITRHGLFGFLIYSTWVESADFIEFKWEPRDEYFFSENTKRLFLGLFLLLQALLIFWFVLICQVALQVISGNNAIDNRSSDSEKEETSNVHKNEEALNTREKRIGNMELQSDKKAN